jgi:hypothetical protein
MGMNFTPCKKPLEQGWAETQAEPSELLPCARSLFFLHCPPPNRALHYVYARDFLIFITMQKKGCMSILKSEASVFTLGISLFEMPPLINSFGYCCWFWLWLSIESRRWFWLLLSNFWPNPKVNSWVLLTFTDNFTIIDNMNRTTWLWKL